jgi:hypothetical protein
MIDTVIANKFGVPIGSIISCYDIFNQIVFTKQIKSHEITNTDKMLLNKLLNNVEDNTEYDYPLQKFYVYMIIFFSNFISEGIFLDIDDEYMNIVIEVLLNTNIIEELFKLL